MGIWKKYGFDKKVLEILKVQAHARVKKSQCGNPFMTSYQIAIAFQQAYPGDFEKIGKPLGGRGADASDSLSKYIAEILIKRIRKKRIKKVKCASLSIAHRGSIPFTDGKKGIYSSAEYDVSLFRRKS
ncbi:MAG: hypothetical protein GY862_08270 [Gammaproteobacteria bacterium]|nr:hypothetical protein [Gammaproteobacteria bacterium]